MTRQRQVRRPRQIYIAIMNAAWRGVGLHLTTDEVWELSSDDAIETVALNALLDEEMLGLNANNGNVPWKNVDPYRDRGPAKHHNRV